MSLSLAFSAKRKDVNTDKLAINRQNFGRARLQLKFMIRPKYPKILGWSNFNILGLNDQILKKVTQNFLTVNDEGSGLTMVPYFRAENVWRPQQQK